MEFFCNIKRILSNYQKYLASNLCGLAYKNTLSIFKVHEATQNNQAGNQQRDPISG